MKLAITSDWHTDATTAGVRRYEEIARSVDRVVETTIAENADVFLFLGDLCDPEDGRELARANEVAIGAERKLRAAKIARFWMPGNHDVFEDGEGGTTLDPLAAAGADVARVPTTRLVIRPSNANVEILFLPYVERSSAYDAEAKLVAFFEDAKADCLVVAGHATHVPGIGRGSETLDMARGRDLEFPLARANAIRSKLAGTKVLLCNGHFHRKQCFDGLWIPGSLARLRFDEEAHEPGFLLVEM